MVCYSITYAIIGVKYSIIEYVIVQYGMSWKESLCRIFVQFVEGLVFWAVCVMMKRVLLSGHHLQRRKQV